MGKDEKVIKLSQSAKNLLCPGNLNIGSDLSFQSRENLCAYPLEANE
jgi:hypothetical protein